MNISYYNHTRRYASAMEAMTAEYDARMAEYLANKAKADVSVIDDAEVVGRINRHELYTPNEADNARYDAGFWGGHPMTRTHCGAKSKRTMLRKRGRI